MSELGDHPVTQFLVITFTAIAGILLVKVGVSYLPEGSVFGAIKKVFLMV